MYRLFGALGSGSAAVEVLFERLGQHYEWIDAAPWEAHAPGLVELRAINPRVQVPTLVTPSGEVLTESVSILWTLAERHGSDWLPAPSTRARAASLRWMSFVSAQIYAPGGIVDHPERWVEREAEQELLGARARERIAAAWRVIADEFRGRDAFVFGASPTLLDLYLANLSRWWGARRMLAAERPVFAALLQRVEAHPDIAPVWKRHGFR